jgi:hypothetical protein
MRISRHDLRRRYSNSLVIDAGSHFTLRACLQARAGGAYSYTRVLPNGFLLKAIVFTVCEHEYVNIHPPWPLFLLHIYHDIIEYHDNFLTTVMNI